MNISVSTIARLLTLSLLMTLPWTQAPAAGVEEDAPGQGTLQGRDTSGQFSPMSLRHTEVRVEVTGFVARVEVIQTFGNPFESAIEARYLFPLPERAAVDDFLLEVGERRVRGEIHRRDEARTIYETARAAGHTASLLDQERPNIFTQSVANIPPGKEVRIHLRYVDILPFADGAYRFLYPMVVGPRYSPTPLGQAAGAGDDTVHASYMRPDSRPGNEIEIMLDIDSGVPIRSLTSESHRIIVTNLGPSRARVALAAGDTLPNKDLMVRWEVAGEVPEVGVLAHRADDEGFFALLIQPKAEVTADEAAPKEIIFVLDQSGSMSGLPIEMSKKFMRLALQTLGARDRFNIVRFDGSATVLAPEPLPNTQQNVRRGLGAVEEMKGSGGTHMLAGFDSALAQPRDPRCIRIVFFLTDGFIGNEEDIFEVIRQRRGDARIFTLGVGSSVNHHLLRGMADLGHGAYQYIRPDGNEEKAVEQFQRWVTKPYLTDLEIDWGGLRVEDVQPSRLPDLYSGQTLSLVGRYLWGGSDTLIIRGRLGGVPWEEHVEVTLPERSESHAALASVWARQRIQDLLMEPGEALGPEIESQVTSLALAFRLMSPFTSFVAVDDSVVVNPGGAPILVDQVLPMPEFVSFEGSFGATGPGRAAALPIRRWHRARADRPTSPPIPVVDGSVPYGQAVIAGVVQDTEEFGLPGAVVVLSSSKHGVSRQAVSDVDGNYRLEGLLPGTDYLLRIRYAGFASIEIGPLELKAGRSTTVDITLRSDAELTETIVVESKGSLVDTENTKTSSNYNSESIEGLPIIGHNYQHILKLAPGVTDTDGDGNPNVHGSRDTGPQYRLDGGSTTDPVSGTFGQNISGDVIEGVEVITSGASAEYGRADGGFANIVTGPGAVRAARTARRERGSQADQPGQIGAASIEEAALRVLADLADDGKLTRSEGLPALAGLLGAQYSNGGFALSVRVQTLATWALAAAAASDPRLRWVPDAARKAAEFLTLLRSPCGLMDPGDDALVDFVLELTAASGMADELVTRPGPAGRCFDARSHLERVRSELGPSGVRLIDRILGGHGRQQD